MRLWNEKYIPKSSSELQAHNKSLERLKNFIINYEGGAVLVHGPVGCGKTVSVHALANELNLEVLEVNASDVRNKEKISQIIGASTKQQSLFKKGKIILVDEVDSLSGTKDRGAVKELNKIISESKFPIILTANDAFQSKIRSLRKKCLLVEFKTLSYLSILKVLKKICECEKVRYDEEALKDLARRAGGDVRAAINDLQMLAEHKKELKKEELEIVGYRESEESIHNALRLIFKSKTAANVLRAFDNVNMDFNGCLLWLDENLPKEYDKEDLAKAYNAISRADVFNGRIRRWQHWRFLVYINALLTAGVALAKKEKRPGFVNYQKTGRIFKLWMAKAKNAKKRAIAEKVGEITHTSVKKALKDMPLLQTIFRKGKGEQIVRELDLSEEETSWLLQ